MSHSCNLLKGILNTTKIKKNGETEEILLFFEIVKRVGAL